MDINGDYDAFTPVEFGDGLTAKHVECGNYHTCAVLNDDTIKCWGRNDQGQLGIGSTDDISDGLDSNGDSEMGDALAAVDLGTGLTAKSVYCAPYAYTCALLCDDTIKCWGKGNYGQLGQGNTAKIGDGLDSNGASEMGNALDVIDLGNGRTVVSIAGVGPRSVCAVLDDYSLKCWGGGAQSGMLGNEEAAYNDDDISDGLDSNGASEMGDNLPAVNLGTGRTVFHYDFCYANEYVSSDECTACPTRTTNATGDDATGSDMTCGECASGYYVSSNVCNACSAEMTNAAGDDKNRADTTCTAICTVSTDSSKDGSDGNFYCINGDTAWGITGSCASCDPGYEGDNCHTAILCAANERVASKVCTACAAGTTNAAGDDATGDDTECSALVEEEEEEEENEVEPAPPTSPDANTTEVLEVLTYDYSSALRLDISIATIGVVFATILAFATA